MGRRGGREALSSVEGTKQSRPVSREHSKINRGSRVPPLETFYFFIKGNRGLTLDHKEHNT